jgi:hypothetical protein
MTPNEVIAEARKAALKRVRIPTDLKGIIILDGDKFVLNRKHKKTNHVI